MADKRISLTREEYLNLIELLNAMMDNEQEYMHRYLSNGEHVLMPVLPLIKKLLVLGERNDWVHVPCGMKPPNWR